MSSGCSLPTVSIGIPAFNEELSIGQLLSSLLRQEERGFIIDHIYVVSDGSTDSTSRVVSSFSDPRICLIDSLERKGKALRLNEIITLCTSDVLVFLDADIKLCSEQFIAHLISPILEGQADFTSGIIQPLPANGVIDRALAHIMQVKNYLYAQLDRGHSLYSCFGPARAFGRQAYISLYFFANVIGEDAYSYIQLTLRGLRFRSVSDAVFFVKVPATLLDHQRQSLRFFASVSEMSCYFGRDVVHSFYRIPFPLSISVIFYSFITSPVDSFVYSFIFLYMRFRSFIDTQHYYFWEVSQTSKRV